MPHSTSQTPLRIERALACRYSVADHREAWPRILPGLEKLHRQYEEQDWDIAGIRTMLDEDRALLLTDDTDPSASGSTLGHAARAKPPATPATTPQTRRTSPPRPSDGGRT